MPQLSDFLKKNRRIYTVRKYEMSFSLVEVSGVGLCKRLPLGVINTKNDLYPYVAESGFSSLDDWWNKICEFIPGKKLRKYIYQVEVFNGKGI